ncbi:hypothetical protein EXIGLDRAFT_652230 [Exidia glandulosa HHB12029]|uniref:Uncharacterized protein n=1 Tax=Exidia glandulosa HHB12029 TaxID=1314781 RepID=A0A165EPG0_EXIGL|nr:hypothetical protein EXIGLDRAFT_652230 [Exidia glandulosa HHB12029]
MSSLRWVTGTQPGVLDPSQTQRVLRSKPGMSTLAFAEYDDAGVQPPQAAGPLNELFNTLHTRRVAVETSSDGKMHWRLVPCAQLRGVRDEGEWPRTVNFLGQETVMMTRDQWDLHKLDPYYVCIVDVNLASIWLANPPQTAPISPPATDSDTKQAKTGAGTSSQPYVVDDTDRPSAPPSAPSPPFSDHARKPNPFAARVDSVSESESDEEDQLDASTPEPAQQPMDVPAPEQAATEQLTDGETQTGTKRKASASPPMERARTPSIISISSDSGAETETPQRQPKRHESRTHGPTAYRRALFEPGGTGSHRSRPPPVHEQNDTGNKRRKLDPNIPWEKFAFFKPSYSAAPSNMWAPYPPQMPQRAAGVSPSPRRARPHTASSPARPALRPYPFYPLPNYPPINVPFKRSQPAQSAESSESEAETPSKKQKTARSHTSKRRASHSPEVEEVPGPIPSSSKRPRTDAHAPPETPRAKARQERAEFKAQREKARKAARPTAALFGNPDPFADIPNIWHSVQSPYAGPSSSASSSQFRPSASTSFESAFPGFNLPPLGAFNDWTLPGFGAYRDFVPKQEPGLDGDSADGDHDSVDEDQQFEQAQEDPGFEFTEEDTARAAAIAESKRKLAELERDRPIWEAAQRKRRQEEDFARRQKEEKARREEQRRREHAARAEQEKRREEQRRREYEEQLRRESDASRRRAQDRMWEKYTEHRKESGHKNHSFFTDDNDFADFKSHYSSSSFHSSWCPPPFSRPTPMFKTKAGSSTASKPSQPWTPLQALDRYNKQCVAFDSSKFTEQSKLSLSNIPWPVLARSPIAVQHVDWDTVGEFFKNVKKFMSTPDYVALVDKSHKRWHPDRWRSRTGAFRFIEGTQEQREEVEKKVNMVSQVLTPLWQETR